jgi:GT2 family glycosyltransferase
LTKALITLSEQTIIPNRVIVVDASDDDLTERVVAEFEAPYEIVYKKNENGRGNTPNSRNIAMSLLQSDVVAYLDDDSYPRQSWAAAMLDAYQRFPDCVAVGGRTLNGIKHEDLQPVDDVGKIHSDGRLSGNFAASVPDVIDIDHMIGANSSWRTEVLRCLGGHFDKVPPGPFGLLEETEVCLRARKKGLRIVFAPLMIADHEGAPQPKSTRFSLRYGYQHARNSTFTYLRIYGVSELFLKYSIRSIVEPFRVLLRAVTGALVRCFLEQYGFVAGVTRYLNYKLFDR